MSTVASTIASWEAFARSWGTLLGSVVFALMVIYILFALIAQVGKRSNSVVLSSVARRLHGPARLLVACVFSEVALSLSNFPVVLANPLRLLLHLGLVVGIAWLSLRAMLVLRDYLVAIYRVDVADNLRSRQILTQFRVIRTVISFLVLVLAAGVMLMSFDAVRQFGVTMLASAGVIGIVLGLAAQSTMSNILAGLQIAFTEPLRIDDVVIVENEWGKIEEITLTYIVVRTWDLRRLVIPITYFTQTPFQNWTRHTADLLGTAFFYVDYTIPVAAVRSALHQILNETPLWDQKVWGLQVTNATEKTVELRALMSAPDASTAWDLRCHVREEIIRFLQANYPDGFPKLRAEFNDSSGSGTAAA
ncbi:MAG TPA: mechanosensitive ion channel domain-containing protein [Dehalococcoidia bacterium]|nr:mechanosensitive ion channel domain-containing protein [Dehalococcoidia bacterium]